MCLVILDYQSGAANAEDPADVCVCVCEQRCESAAASFHNQ